MTGTLTAVASSGVATFSGLAAPTLAQAGLKLTFTDGSLASATVNDTTSITVNPGAVSQLVIAPATISSATAGTAFALTSITAEDAYGNVCGSGPNAFTSTVTYGGTAGVTGTSADVQCRRVERPERDADEGGQRQDDHGDLRLGHGHDHHHHGQSGGDCQLLGERRTPQTRGTAFNVTVTAKDASGNTVTTDSSTEVTMTSSTGNVLFDANGDGSFNDNSQTLSSGTFTISTKDNVFRDRHHHRHGRQLQDRQVPA